MDNFKLKFILFLIVSVLAPVCYVIIRFNLFTTKQSLSVWAVLIVVLLLCMVVLMIKFYVDGMKTKYSLFKQILVGGIKVILPILVILGLAIFLKVKAQWILDNLNLMIEALLVLLVCESVAVVINPLPKWAFDNNVEGLINIADKITKKDGE